MKKSELRRMIKEELLKEDILKIGDYVRVSHPGLAKPFDAKITYVIQDKGKGILVYSLGKHGVWDSKFVEKTN